MVEEVGGKMVIVTLSQNQEVLVVVLQTFV